MKNRGINIEKERLEQSEIDWKFGTSSLRCMAQIPITERTLYLPKGELQFGKEDFMDCATRGVLNVLETKFNYLLKTKLLPDEQWFKDNGYIMDNGFELSDRFTAIMSNTTREGNSIKAPLDSVRKNGVIPKSLLKANPDMTWADYHNKSDIKDKMVVLGQEFLTKLSINYEKVYESQFSVFDDILDVAGFAWSTPINGIYPRIDGQPNHVWMNIRPQYYIFDNYIDSTDEDFIKKLSPDYDFYDYGYRIIISLPIQKQYKSFLDILKAMVKLMQRYVDILKKSGAMVGAIIQEVFSKRN